MSIIKNEFNQHVQVSLETLKTIEKSLESSAITCMNALSKGNKILLCGNGGSAADAQHIAAELVGRYKTERRGLPAIALTTDTSTITSIANDFGYSKIFERQVEAIANKGDVLIGISTGGTSLNVINALKIAKNLECKTIGLSGKGGGNFNDICDINIIVPSDDTARIQEMHILIGHTICHFIDQKN
tara:strand:+ start:3212 stop:3772 length:561 start_codon:yes stop_codon:yes gene_type:complete